MGWMDGLENGTMSLLPSRWVQRHAVLIEKSGCLLDYACGSGRHARWLADRGWNVLAVDRDENAVQSLKAIPGITALCADLEKEAWPFGQQRFQALIITNYLFRPRFNELLALLAPGGVLIYETFMQGNERYGKPSNPEYLLYPGELLVRLSGKATVVAFEQGRVEVPKPALVQRICAIKGDGSVKIPE